VAATAVLTRLDGDTFVPTSSPRATARFQVE